MALSPAQIESYYASQSNAASPISPLEYEKQLNQTSTTVPSQAFTDTNTTAPSTSSKFADIQTEINNISGQLGGGSTETAVLSPSQISGYYASQSGAENPLSPTDYLKGLDATLPAVYKKQEPTERGDYKAETLMSDPPIQVYRDANGNITRKERLENTTKNFDDSKSLLQDDGSFSSLLDNFKSGRADFLETAKTALGIGGDQTSLREEAEGLFPETPQALLDIDLELSELNARFQEASNGIQDQAGRGLRFIEGDQRRLNREFESQSARLEGRRAAIQGDFDRATDKAKFILDLEREDRKDERERQQAALDILSSELEGEEAILLAQFQRQLDKQDIEDERKFEREQGVIDEVSRIISGNPEEFKAHFQAGGQYPTTIAQANTILSKGTTPDGGDGIFTTTDGEDIDLTTVDGVARLKELGFTDYAEAYAFMDENTKLTTGAIKNLLIAGGFTPTEDLGDQFIDEDFIREAFTEEQLKAAAKEAGFTAGGFLGFGVGDEGIRDYIDSIISGTETRRAAGMTDADIFKEMTK